MSKDEISRTKAVVVILIAFLVLAGLVWSNYEPLKEKVSEKMTLRKEE